MQKFSRCIWLFQIKSEKYSGVENIFIGYWQNLLCLNFIICEDVGVWANKVCLYGGELCLSRHA